MSDILIKALDNPLVIITFLILVILGVVTYVLFRQNNHHLNNKVKYSGLITLILVLLFGISFGISAKHVKNQMMFKDCQGDYIINSHSSNAPTYLHISKYDVLGYNKKGYLLFIHNIDGYKPNHKDNGIFPKEYDYGFTKDNEIFPRKFEFPNQTSQKVMVQPTSNHNLKASFNHMNINSKEFKHHKYNYVHAKIKNKFIRENALLIDRRSKALQKVIKAKQH